MPPDAKKDVKPVKAGLAERQCADERAKSLRSQSLALIALTAVGLPSSSPSWSLISLGRA